MIFYPKIIFLIFVNVSYADEILFNIKLVTDLLHFFTIKWLIVYSCDKSSVNPSFFKFLKDIKKHTDNLFISFYDCDDFFRFSNLNNSYYHKSLVLFPCSKCEKSCLTKVSNHFFFKFTT